ncbi:MAG TPA: hypothetical protein ENJ00_00020 [Phycisphaerales bacterium]|nr:hypothetical protein [Phycisphaerales bacterium]
MLRLYLTAALSASILFVAGCNSTGTPASHAQTMPEVAVGLDQVILGTWKLDPTYLRVLMQQVLVKNGIDVDSLSQDEFNAIIESAKSEVEFILVFNDTGVVVGSSRAGDIEEKFEGRWAVEGNTVRLYNETDDEEFTGTYDGGRLTIAVNTGPDGEQIIRLIKP